MRHARGAYQIGLPIQSRADQCFQTFHLSQTWLVTGLSNRSSWKVVENRQGRPEQPGTTTGQLGWENVATRRTYSKIRPFVESPFIPFYSFFFSFFPFSVARCYCTFPTTGKTHNYGLMWRNRTAKDEERMKKTELSGTISLTDPPTGTKVLNGQPGTGRSVFQSSSTYYLPRKSPLYEL
jgi:hypothetical protein